MPGSPSLITLANAISLAQAAKIIPGRPAIPTVWRWCRHGLRGVRLEYVRAGRRMVTSAEAVADFMRRLAEADDFPPGAPRPPRNIDRVAHEEANRRCAEAGW